jgi:hypothetical protein
MIYRSYAKTHVGDLKTKRIGHHVSCKKRKKLAKLFNTVN